MFTSNFRKIGLLVLLAFSAAIVPSFTESANAQSTALACVKKKGLERKLAVSKRGLVNIETILKKHQARYEAKKTRFQKNATDAQTDLDKLKETCTVKPTPAPTV